MKKQITVAIAGLGARGKDTYAIYQKLFPSEMKIVAVAEPKNEVLYSAAMDYNIPLSNCFSSAEEMFEKERLADAVFITTQDRQHKAHTLMALEKGYHILLEKPVASTVEDCIEIRDKALASNSIVIVCHVLRYTPFYRKIKELLDSGIIGDIVSIQASEWVGYWHQAHSFVRGNWNNSTRSSSMILQKCCHDMDILHWLIGKTCKSLSSYGSLMHFNDQNAPKKSGSQCIVDCKCKKDCIYDAEKIYITNPLTGVLANGDSWPCNVVMQNPTKKGLLSELKTSPYGKCVYKCDNNVVDHQVISMEFEGGATAVFTMTAFTEETNRQTKILGTKGELCADMNQNSITVLTFGGKKTVFDVNKLSKNFSGHGGGDHVMLKEFLEAVSNPQSASPETTLNESINSHLMTFAAEESRHKNGKNIAL